MALDELDGKIIRYLTADGRLSARNLAFQLNVSTVTVLSRIRKMEQSGVIGGYSALVNHEKLGYPLTAIIEIMAEKNKIVDTEEMLAEFKNVCGVYDITGTTDMLVIAKFRERSDLNDFVKRLSGAPEVKATITHLVLNTIKEEFGISFHS